MKADSRHRVRALNDAFRQTLEGGHVALSAGVAALPARAVSAIIEAVRSFDRFDADTDPYSEHDFGTLEIDGERFFWKFDCYDRSLRRHSLDATDPDVTTRVLTVMLASEY